MDATTVTSPHVRAWEILTGLAEYGRSISGDAQSMVQRIAELAQEYLPCPWGVIALEAEGATINAGWGISPEWRERLIERAVPIPAQTIELPLYTRDEPAGMLWLGMPAAHHEQLTPGFLTTLRHQIELLIALLHREAASAPMIETTDGSREQRYASEIDTLRALSAHLGSGLTLDELPAAVVKWAQQLAPCTTVLLSLLNPETGLLEPAASIGARLEPPAPVASNDYQTLSEWVARHRRTIRLSDIRYAPIPPAVVAFADGHPIGAYMATPLQVGNQVVGVLELMDVQPDRLSEHEERLIAILAAQAAQSVASAQRYVEDDEHLQGRLLQLRSLQRISRELTSTLYLHNILDFALKEALRATRATHGYVALRGYTVEREAFEMEQSDALGVTVSPQTYVALRSVGENGPVRLIVAEGYAPEDDDRLINTVLHDGRTIAASVVARGEARIVEKLTGDDRPAAVGPLPVSTLAAPIYYEEQVIGVINLHSVRARAFNRDALDFIRAVADQIALAIGNEERYHEQRRQRDLLAQRATTLNEVLRIGQEMRADRSLDEVLEQIAFSVAETARFRSVAFYLIDNDESATASLVAAAGLPLSDIERLRRRHLPVSLLEHLLDSQYRIGRSFFVPGQRMRDIIDGADLRLLSPLETEGSRTPDEWQVDDVLIVPLYRSKSRLVGVMVVDEPYDRQLPTPRSVETLEIFADQAAIAIENAMLLREARSQAEQMASLYRASAAMVSSLDLDSLLERIYEEIVAHVGVPSFCFVASYNPLRDELCFEMFKREGVMVSHLHKRTIARSGLSGWVIDQGRMLYIEDYLEEQDRLSVKPVNLGEPIRSWVGIPLMRQNQTIGVLSVQSFEPRAFSARDVQWLSTVANQLAVALSNAQLFAERGQRINELNLINHIGHITSSTFDIEQMLAGVYEALSGFLSIEAFAACVYDGEQDQIGQAFVVAGGERVCWRVDRPPSASGLIRRVIDTGQPVRMKDLRYRAVDPCLNVMHPADADRAFASSVGVPLVVGEHEVVGVIVLQSDTTSAYGDRELAFLNTVAVQVALGVQNIRLFTEARDSATALQRKVGELSALLRAAQVLSSSLKPDDVLQSLMAIVAGQLQVDTVALWKIDADGFLTPAAMQGISLDMARVLRVPIGKGLTGRVAASGQPLVITNVEEDGTSLYPQFNREHQYTSFMGVPVAYREQTIGVLSVMTVAQRAFSADEVALMAGIADQAAIALENARLFAERERRIAELTALNHISQAINVSLSTGEILEALHRGMSEVLDTSQSFIALYDAKTRRLTCPLVYEDGCRALDEEAEVVVLDELSGGLTPTIIFERRPLLLRTQQEVEAVALRPADPDEPPICSWLGAPILQGDEVFGVLNVQSYEPGKFDEDAQRFLVTVANQAAIALSNVRLFQSEQARRRVADTLREVAQMMTGVLALDDIFALILDQLARIVHYDTASLMLRDGDTLRIVAARGFDESIRDQVERLQLRVDDDPSLAQVVYSRRPLVLVDAREAPPSSVDDGTEHIRGWVGAPLMLGDEVIGILNVDSATVGAYDEEDAQLVFALASQAAQAIRNARLFAEVRRFNTELEQLVSERTAELQDAYARLTAERDRLQAVHTITLELTASLDLQTTLNRALELASKAVGARRGSIMLHDLQSGRLACRAVLNADGSVESKNFLITFEKGLGLSGWVMHQQEAVCIADVRDDTRWLHEEGRAEEVRSVIAAPLMTQDGPLGVLILTSPEIDFFNQDQLQLLATIANEVAIVIHNATLYTIINEIAAERGELWSQQREENSKNQAILQSLGEGVIVVDDQQHIVLYNAAAEQILRIPATFVANKPLARIAEYSCEDDGVVERARRIYEGLHKGLQALTEAEKNHNRVLDLPQPDQSIVLNFAPWVGPRNAMYGSVVVLHDITREVEADRAKREFISNVSHELRTPLTSIKGYVDLLMLGASGPLNEGQMSFLSVVKNNAHRLMSLINDILEIGRIDDNKVRLNFENISIGAIFEEVGRTLRAEIERKRLSFSIEVAEDTPSVMADETRLTQVVLNLVSNAVKYTYPEGSVKLRAGLNPAGLLQVDVIDNGVGISPEQQQHLFRRFYRADNPLRDEAGGTGLGLSIAKSYVEMHGGQMWVESEPGRGSTFSFIIPLTQPAPETEPSATKQSRS